MTKYNPKFQNYVDKLEDGPEKRILIEAAAILSEAGGDPEGLLRKISERTGINMKLVIKTMRELRMGK